MGLVRGGVGGAFGSGGVAHSAGSDRPLRDKEGDGLFDDDDSHLIDLGIGEIPPANKEVGPPRLTMSGRCSSALLPELA